MTDTSGGFRAARGCAPVPPDAELPAAIIRRLRDGEGMTVTVLDLMRQERRMEAAYAQLAEVARAGENVAEWESRWLALLDEYEALYTAATEQELTP